MNAQKMTQKSLEALQAAQSLAVEYENQALAPEHLFCALLGQENGLIGQLFRAGQPCRGICKKSERAAPCDGHRP